MGKKTLTEYTCDRCGKKITGVPFSVVKFIECLNFMSTVAVAKIVQN